MSSRTVTTISFGSPSRPRSRRRRIVERTAWSVGGAAVVLTLGVLTLAPASVDFDGMIGPGCDPGNPLCSFVEWRKGCTTEDVRTGMCGRSEWNRRLGTPPTGVEEQR